jgi:quercetin dioxygenase-like cupin family protein
MFIYSDKIPFEDLGAGVKRKILTYSDNIMQVLVDFEKNAIGAMHNHKHEQVTYVLSGVFEFTIGDEVKIVKSGDCLYKKPYIMHGCKCLEAGQLLDTFTPKREDFLQSS